MASGTVTNGRALFNSVPEGYPDDNTILYDTTQSLNLSTTPLNGGILLKILDVSIDPYLRGRMRAPNTKSYSPPFTLGEPIENFAVAVVVRSDSEKYKEGDKVYGLLPFVNYAVVPPTAELRVLSNTHNLPWSAYVGAAGMPGKTAYMAWKEYSAAKEGETVFVSGGAGPVGSFVIQLAKRQGLKVIGSAGSDEKVALMKECGADVAFNYKTTSTREVLEKEGGIDVYWDNVGGETLELALEFANVGARFIECGMISGYNKGGVPIRNLMLVVAKSITMQGFIVSRLHAKYEEAFYDEIPKLLASGELKHKEHVWQGLDKTGEAILAVQKGTNRAKAIIHVADA